MLCEDIDPKKILVADDDPVSQTLLRSALVKWGYRVVTCNDGQEALDLLLQGGIGLAILDWSMPGIEGIEICREVRKIPKRSRYLILLTARSSTQDLIEGLEAGADDFIRKPFNTGELRARLKTGERILELERSLQELAIRDPLTGLYNRRYMEETVLRELSRATRSRGSIGIILLDIDHFKRFNDQYGHQTGDQVLCELSRLIKDQIRSADVPCRYGGEEFLLILPGASLSVTANRAEQIRVAVKNIRIHNNNREIEEISISAGVSAFPDHGITPDELFRKADLALYAAKEEGRDCVVICREISTDSKSLSPYRSGSNFQSG